MWRFHWTCMHLNRSWRYGLSQSTDENLYGNRVSQGIGIYNVMYVPLMIHSVMELLLSPHPVQVVEMTIKSTHDSRGDIESLMSATHLEFGVGFRSRYRSKHDGIQTQKKGIRSIPILQTSRA